MKQRSDPQSHVQRARRFVRDYTEGLNVRDLRQLFDRDAQKAYQILARDREDELEPADDLRRFFYRAKVLFLGLSYKLSPTRRAVFVVSLVLALIGLVGNWRFNMSTEQTSFSLDFSPVWFLGSILGLLWLLTMELVDRVRVRDELEVARNLQRDLLPTEAPSLDSYAFAHSYRTANEVGGDYYDFQVLPDGRLAILVGDASGHGIAAGLLMAIANATLKTAIDIDPTPVPVISLLNGTLFRTGDRRAFMTLFYGLLDPASGSMDFVCAGHPFPLLRRAGGQIVELGKGNLPLGMRPKVTVEQETVLVEPGDVLVLFTDGLVEAISSQEGESFGFSRLKEQIAGIGSPKVLHDRILLSFDQHTGREAITDDITLAIIARVAH